MAELTRLDDTLGAVLGIARAARHATTQVARAVDDADIARTLAGIREESAETARRCDAVVGRRDGRKTAIRTRARASSKEAREMMTAFLASADGPLRRIEFLGMTEAEEMAQLEILGGLALAAADEEILALVEWARPIQERHVANVRDAGVVLAVQEDPAEVVAAATGA